MLTRKQYELLMFIHERVRESGIPPSFDEMKDALDLKSKSGIHRLITALEERGFLRRMEKRARALEIMKLPDNVSETLRPATTRSQSMRAVPRHGRAENRVSMDARMAGGLGLGKKKDPRPCRGGRQRAGMFGWRRMRERPRGRGRVFAREPSPPTPLP